MNVSCPQCGNKNQSQVPDSFIKCEACGSSLFIDIDTITVAYSYSTTVASENVTMYLKRDFEKIGFNEKMEIGAPVPIYIPFWLVEGENVLHCAHALFPEKDVAIPSGSKIFFEANKALQNSIDVLSIDTQPATPKKRAIYYLPFFTLNVRFNEHNFTYYVNAVNGEVKGAPLPYIPSQQVMTLFYIFITFFFVFAFSAFLIGRLFYAAIIDIAVGLLLYRLAEKELGRQFYSNVGVRK